MCIGCMNPTDRHPFRHVAALFEDPIPAHDLDIALKDTCAFSRDAALHGVADAPSAKNGGLEGPYASVWAVNINTRRSAALARCLALAAILLCQLVCLLVDKGERLLM